MMPRRRRARVLRVAMVGTNIKARLRIPLKADMKDMAARLRAVVRANLPSISKKEKARNIFRAFLFSFVILWAA